MDQLQINTALQIAKPRQEVFEAIVDPMKMSHYFISESTGRMEQGKSLSWKFPEFPEAVPVEVLEVKPHDLISFEWEGAKDQKMKVEIRLLEMSVVSTLVKITEGTMQNDAEGIKWFGQNTEGWANFLACLKAYLEYGINLRKGAFDFMKEKKAE